MELKQIESVLDKMYEAGEIGDSTRNLIISRMVEQIMTVSFKPKSEWLRDHPEFVQEEDDKRLGDATC